MVHGLYHTYLQLDCIDLFNHGVYGRKGVTYGCDVSFNLIKNCLDWRLFCRLLYLLLNVRLNILYRTNNRALIAIVPTLNILENGFETKTLQGCTDS